MSFVQTYSLIAAAGQEHALERVMKRLAEAVRPIDGCTGVLIMRDVHDPQQYIFTESYIDEAAHQASSSRIDKGLLAELMGLLSTKPSVSRAEIILEI